MEWTDDQLNEIELHAHNLMTIEEIADILEIDHVVFLQEIQKKKGVYKRLRKGRLLAKSVKQASEIDLAHRGHTDAQKRVEIKLKEIEQDDNRHTIS